MQNAIMTIERTGAESQGLLETQAAYLEQAYRQEVLRVQRFRGSLAEARRLYRQWHAYRGFIAARDRALWGAAPTAPARKAA